MTKNVSSFQRFIDSIIRTEKLKDTFVYINNVTVCVLHKSDHDRRLKHFMEAIKYNLILNYCKFFFGVTTINLLGYTVSERNMKPDIE